MANKKKIEWISILQGWSMLLVIIGHITLTNQFKDPAFPFSAFLEKIIYSFHMPLFMFISGYLFHLTRINKNATYQSVIIDKLKRFGIPFSFFTSLTIILKLLLSHLMKSPVILELNYFIDVFILFKTNPLGEMWFLVTLFILMLFYPLYCYLIKNTSTIIIGTFIILTLYWINPHNIQIFQTSNVLKMGIFFWGGILFSRFQLSQYLQSFYVFGVICILFIGSEIINSHIFITNILGIIFSFSLCIQLSKKYPSLFSSFRNYTYQIFLMGIFFQMGTRYLYLSFNNNNWYIPCYLLSIILGLYIPVLISKYIKQKNHHLINLCFGIN